MEILKFMENNSEMLAYIETLGLTRSSGLVDQYGFVESMTGQVENNKNEREKLIELIFSNCHNIVKWHVIFSINDTVRVLYLVFFRLMWSS